MDNKNMILHFTQKFLTKLRIKKTDIKMQLLAEHPLDDWYAHIFFLYPRRKCAFFMHAKTRFCFFAFDKNRDQLNDLKGIFQKGLGRALFDEHYPVEVIKLFNDRQQDIRIGKTSDRSVVSLINRRIFELQCLSDFRPDDRRLFDEHLAGLSFRRTIILKEKCPIEQMSDLLTGCPELKGVEMSPALYKHEELEKFFATLHSLRQDRV